MESRQPDPRAPKKTGNRRKGREIALQMLYLADNCRYSLDEAKKTILTENCELHVNIANFALELLEGITKEKNNLDDFIMGRAKNWKLDRMAAIDRNILRLATYELVHMPQTPVNVIIDEAVEIAKSYSTSESGKFVNGILDKLKSERTQEKKGKEHNDKYKE